MSDTGRDRFSSQKKISKLLTNVWKRSFMSHQENEHENYSGIALQTHKNG